VRVEAFASERGLDLAAAERELAKTMGVARFGEPSEIASAVAFLASAPAAFCHGSILDIDGGQTRTR
jgi:3-oxoacyl-[acyl-carrier protein] reductase